jgi:hypothetical protein
MRLYLFERMIMNKANCNTCEYKELNDDPSLHCYMFRTEPKETCHQHTVRVVSKAQLSHIQSKVLDKDIEK